jgi:DnaA family protein
MRQIPLPLAAADAAGFDDYVAGRNAAALAHLRALADAAAAATPVYLWGPPGCGKTHLLRALAARRAGAGAVARFDAAAPLPWDAGSAPALVVVDGVDALDAARQHAAFALYVEAAGAGWPLVCAGRLPPVDLPLREDLRTRLGGGLVFALQALTDAERGAALRARAQARGLDLADEVVGFLLTHHDRDMTHLMDLLHRLDDQAWVDRRARITLPLLRRALAGHEAAHEAAPAPGSAA